MFSRLRASARRGTHSLIEGPDTDWDLQRLRMVLISAVFALAAVLAGIGATIYFATRHDDPTTSAAGTANGGGGVVTTPGAGKGDQQDRLQVAASPMTSLPPAAAAPGDLVAATAAPISVPKHTRIGPAGIPTGFPRTPEGALGQLAAIDEATLSVASVNHARAIITAWATPQGPTPTTWTGVKAMTTILTAARMPSEAASQLGMSYTVSAGQIKGSGADWAVVCVDGVLDITDETTGRAAVADCQQMTWSGDRWMITGPEPAPASDVWPGTQAAYTAGWKDLNRG